MQRLQTQREGNSPSKRKPFPSRQKHTNKHTTRKNSPPKDKPPFASRNLSQEKRSLLSQIERLPLSRKSSLNCRLVLISASPLKLPFHPPFESCICLRGPSDRMRVENRPFDAPFAADGDMATVTWSNLPERLKGRSVALIVRRMPEAEPNLPPDNCF